MVYSDLLFFLGVLPVSILLSFFDRSTEYKNLILILTSLIFFSWGRPFAVCLIFLTCITEWLFGLWIDKIHKSNAKGYIPLVMDLVVDIAVLFIAGRYLYIADDVFGFAGIIIPMSVCFYILRGFSYVYGVFNGNTKAERNVFCLMTYMCAYFFLPVGAYTNYNEIEPQIRKRSLTLNGLSGGLTAFVCGLSKAVIPALSLKKVGDAWLNSEKITALGCWIGVSALIGFTYFLFTGFCDISYGLGRIYGFDFERNYKDITAKGVFGGFFKNTNRLLAEFMTSLNSEIFNKIHLKWLGAILLGAIAGLWYSRSFVFAAAGIIIGVFAVMEESLLKGFFGKAPRLLRLAVTYTGVFLICGLIFLGGFKDFGKWILGLVGIGTEGIINAEIKEALLNNIFVIAAAILTLCTPLKNKIKTKVNNYSLKSIEKYGKVSIAKTVLTAILLVICIIIIASANIKL